jgi:hypothetical protein
MKESETKKIEITNIMKTGSHAARAFAAALLLWICGSALPGSMAPGASMHGAAGQMPAYYDGELFTVNMKEMPNSDPLIDNNGSINIIFASNDLDEEQDFVPVLDAIQGDGFNPLWLQVLIVFNPGFTPHQFTSDVEIEEAASGPHPEIRFDVTDEVYRCAVVGRK